MMQTGCGSCALANETGQGEEVSGSACKPHGALKESCFICEPSLREKGRLWCKEHDRYEDRCFLCHPNLEDKDREWCKEHHLYEDECLLCRPPQPGEANKGKHAPACKPHGALQTECFICDSSLREKGRLWCKEHDRYEDRCFLCHPDLEDRDRAWCKEHHLYEDECSLCQPPQTEEAVRSRDTSTCKPHDALQSKCFMCNPSLREKGRLWCKEHDRYEDRCFLCHPELEDKDRAWCKEHYLYEDECILCRTNQKGATNDDRDPKRLWCDEHGVYEDECVICHPEIKGTSGAAKGAVLYCKEHDVDEQDCGICHPELVTELDPGHGLKIRFASDKATAKAGVKTSTAKHGAISGGIDVFAEIMFNQNKLAHIALPVDGIVRSVDVDLGDQVKAGDVLATVSSVEISKAIGDYRRAIAQDRLWEQTVERERTLRDEKISAEKDLQEAIAAHQVADAEVIQTRQQLVTLGLSASQISQLEKAAPGTSVLEVRAPFDGEVVARKAVQGALAETGSPLFKVADRSIMWAMLNVPANKVDQLDVGQDVEISLDSDHGQTFVGRLTWVAAEIDEHTRMAKARAEVSNPDNRLRSGAFARGRIITTSADAAVIIPQSSLQQVDNRPLAFVKLEEDLYEARPIKLGAKQGDHYQVLDGLHPGETIVVENSFVMKSQLLLSRLGAGCVDD